MSVNICNEIEKKGQYKHGKNSDRHYIVLSIYLKQKPHHLIFPIYIHVSIGFHLNVNMNLLYLPLVYDEIKM